MQRIGLLFVQVAEMLFDERQFHDGRTAPMEESVFQTTRAVAEFLEIGEARALHERPLYGVASLGNPTGNFPFLTGHGGQQQGVEPPDIEDWG